MLLNLATLTQGVNLTTAKNVAFKIIWWLFFIRCLDASKMDTCSNYKSTHLLCNEN